MAEVGGKANWPSGVVQTLKEVPANRIYKVAKPLGVNSSITQAGGASGNLISHRI
jgi:hypothetical protein